MLFNSQFFIFVFLPATLAIYLGLGALSRTWALRWIVIASLVFYAWWRPENLLIIVPAIVVNFGLARTIQKLSTSERQTESTAILVLGIIFNLCILGYFKYANFAITATNNLIGTDFTLRHIVLPLGISFITFQMIAFLIDVHGKRVNEFRFHEFTSFVLFFPQLIAGPIVHFREMMPQFRNTPCRWDLQNVSVGMTLFLFGLFKKVFLADSIAPMVSSIYAGADAGAAVSLIPAWLAAIGFTFQIYFDFSGYTDMALGAARLFGIKLPINFNSPLRSSNIIDFWLRWHVSLTRFLTAYVYNPLALNLTRRRMQSGRKGLAGPNTTLGAYLQVVLLPIVFTMLISGIWHGAGYLFVLWGLLHGIFLSINHGWRLLVQKTVKNMDAYRLVMQPLGFVITFVSVAVSMVLFRSTSFDAASNILAGMLGLNGIQVPTAVYERLISAAGWLQQLGLAGELANFANLRSLAIWLLALSPIVFCMPNTLQLLARREPAIGFSSSGSDPTVLGVNIAWRSSIAWSLAIMIIGWTAIMNIGGYSEFLYWQF